MWWFDIYITSLKRLQWNCFRHKCRIQAYKFDIYIKYLQFAIINLVNCCSMIEWWYSQILDINMTWIFFGTKQPYYLDNYETIFCICSWNPQNLSNITIKPIYMYVNIKMIFNLIFLYKCISNDILRLLDILLSHKWI